MEKTDAILILGGGLTTTGEPAPWVIPRLERALEYPGSPFLVTLGAGTPHKPPPIDVLGYPVNECAAMARYLIQRGYPVERIVMEPCSADTIGNAYFARILHTEPRDWKRLVVITSEFHMPRTEAIFSRVFALPTASDQSVSYSIDFAAVKNTGLDQESLQSRLIKERKALTNWLWKAATFSSMLSLSQWIFSEHECYSAARTPQRVIGSLANSY